MKPQPNWPVCNCGHRYSNHRFKQHGPTWRWGECRANCDCKRFTECEHLNTLFGWGDEVRCVTCGVTLAVADG